MNTIYTAFEYARQAHQSIGQVRKYSGNPYIVHPARVVEILIENGVNTPSTIEAGYLHDVIEDVYPTKPEYSLDAIEKIFGAQVRLLVNELTDQYTKESYPQVNRVNRKQLEAERIAKISDEGLKIKLADMIDNTSDIIKNDPGFARVYLNEKQRVLNLLKDRIEVTADQSLKKLYTKALPNTNDSRI